MDVPGSHCTRGMDGSSAHETGDNTMMLRGRPRTQTLLGLL